MRGLSVLMDIVPCHTSIEHRWFREHPDWYLWRDEPNNWLSAFGGSAWRRLGDRYYMDSREISFDPPGEWIYRASRLRTPGQPPAPKNEAPPPPAGEKDKVGG